MNRHLVITALSFIIVTLVILCILKSYVTLIQLTISLITRVDRDLIMRESVLIKAGVINYTILTGASLLDLSIIVCSLLVH